MTDRWRFLLNRVFERLWVKPLLICLLSICLSYLARLADTLEITSWAVDASAESLETLLKVMSSSMLVIATFAVSSMVAAYASASSTATPRSFPLIVSDDVSQNALSAFVGAFIFSIVSLVSLQNGVYAETGRLVLFAFTIAVFAIVIVTFVRWVDSIARLGRLGSTVRRVEEASATMMRRRRQAPRLGCSPLKDQSLSGQPIYSDQIGYVQRIDMASLQNMAETQDLVVAVVKLPGAFVTLKDPIAFCRASAGGKVNDTECGDIVRKAFVIGLDRTFDDDPRFGLIVLSEIACRALSPAVNDPGTAIDTIGSFVRLFTEWQAPCTTDSADTETPYTAVEVPQLALSDMLEDAFRGLARDGAGTVEVIVRLQKALQAIADVSEEDAVTDIRRFARDVETRSLEQLSLESDIAQVRAAGAFAYQ